MSKVGGLGIHEVGGYLYIHSEYIWLRQLVFNTFFTTTYNFGGAQPHPYQKMGGLNPPPLPPRFSASDT